MIKELDEKQKQIAYEAWCKVSEIRYPLANVHAAVAAVLEAQQSVLEIALEFAAKDCLNSEGTYGEAMKRMKLIEEWVELGEREYAARNPDRTPEQTAPDARDAAQEAVTYARSEAGKQAAIEHPDGAMRRAEQPAPRERKGKFAFTPPSGDNDWWMINDMERMYAVVSVQSSVPDAEKITQFAWDKIVHAEQPAPKQEQKP